MGDFSHWNICAKRKAKANLELGLASEEKDNKKSFFNYVNKEGRLAKMWVHYFIKLVSWEQGMLKRQRC